MNRLRFLVLRDLFITAALLLPMGLHDLYHFSDWLNWGLDWDGMISVRLGLGAMFEHNFLGYVSHALVLLTAWVAAAFLVARLIHYALLLERSLLLLLEKS